jgi:lipase
MNELSTTTYLPVNGVQLALHERRGSGLAIFFVHATGFHGHCWDEVIRLLPGRRCLAVDVRGHGYSEAPPPPYRWSTLGADITEVVQALELRGAIGVGHSMGGHLLVQAALQQPDAFAGLLLIEPVIFARTHYGEPVDKEEHFAARRRNQWQSPEEMIERFAGRPPFATWQPQVLRDYAVHGLRPAADGDGYVLACPPAVEASIYGASTHPDANLYPFFGQLNIPVWVIRAGEPQPPDRLDMRASPTAPDLASHFPQGRDEHFPDHSHFLPMEDPRLVAGQIQGLSAETVN